MGAFSRVLIKIEQKGPLTFSSVEHIGDYSKVSGPMNELDAKLRAVGFNPTVGIGIYYDDPSKVDKVKLRSEVGSVIPAQERLLVEGEKNNFNFKILPQKDYLVVEFPLRNTLSFMIGVMKVYPVMNKYIAEHNYLSGPSVELYDMTNKKIYFLMEAKPKY